LICIDLRIKIQTDCESTSQRLTDIAFQLEDAVEDWRRFIEQIAQVMNVQEFLMLFTKEGKD
jgi:hypothetical protein